MTGLLRWLLLIGVLALGGLLWLGGFQPDDKAIQRGINYVAYGSERYGDESITHDLTRMRRLGVEYVAFVATWFQDKARSTRIAPHPDETPTDQALTHAIRRAQQLGLKAVLRPMVDVHDGTWRGEIYFNEDAHWEAWFRSYRWFLIHYAQLAEREDIALLSVGVELERTVGQDTHWRRIITDVREIYDGPLTYSANWDGYRNVPFWDEIDYVGIDAYFELDVEAGAPPTVDELVTAWRPWAQALERFAGQNRQPILLTEVGIPSVLGNSRRPWDWTHDGPVAVQEQAHYYEAVFRTFWDRPWLAGVYWWAWLPGWQYGGSNDESYTPAGKPAADVLRSWYTH